MEALAQLRVRSEHSFRSVFGPISRIVETLQEMGTPAAGMVDASTWGHVKWFNACKKAGVKPLFGFEFTVPISETHKPVAWMLAKDTRAFYRLTTALLKDDADHLSLLRNAQGVIRFAGAALRDPDCFDYIDLNPSSPLQQRAALELHKKTGKPLVITSDNSYPATEDFAAFLAMGGRERTSPQHILDICELRSSMSSLSKRQFDRAITSTMDVAAMCATTLPRAPLIKVDGDFRAIVEAGRKRRIKEGFIKKWTKEYDERLKREIEVIEAKGYQSYFMVVAELVNWAKTKMFVGPGRGSSAGSLLCFLVGITEVDPLPHGLLFERFIDMTRFDLPDIDIDFSDTRRDMVFDHLRSKYGEDHIARVGNVSTLKGRSLIAEVCKRFRIPDAEKFKLYDVLVEHERGSERFGKSMIDTFETDIGKAFIQRYPQAAVMTELEAHAWHTSIHAAGVIVSNDPVSDYCTVGSDGVAQITKPDAEALNLLKIDALGLRTLGVIEDSGVVTPDELYRLPLNDKKVFDIFNAHRYSSVFQFEGSQQKLLSNEVRVDDFRTIDHLTALARPGPLGGGAAAHYIKRKAGLEEIDFIHRLARPILADTYGVMLYQEQVMRMVREIGGFSWEDTSIIRKAISLSKGAETVNKLGQTFLKGAMKNGVSEKVARELWSMIVTFGGYGMNRAHTCSYAIISYYCAWMKAYHPLEFAAACLRSAKDDDAALAVLREMRDEGINYTPFDVDLSTETWSVVDGKLIGGFQNLVGIGPAKAATAVEQRNNGSLDREKFLAMKVKFDDLYPLQSKYRQWYLNPESMGCAEGSTLLTADRFPDHGDVLYLGKIVEKQPGDDNDPKRVEKRGGKTYKGNTLFVDFILKDDLGMPVRCRVNRRDWEHLGKLANERLNVGDDLLVRGDKLPGYSMFIVVNRLMCLNRPEALR